MMTDKLRTGAAPKPKPPEPDAPVFFRAAPPPAASPETHHMVPNPEFDRSGINRREGIDTGLSFFTEGISGVREGYENAMRVLVMSNNALFETDVERRVAAIKEALNLMESVSDDENAADVIASHKGLLLGSMAAALMARRQGDAARNRSDAIDYYQCAMQHFTTQDDRENVLKTKYNMADAYTAGVSSDDRSDGRLAMSYLREVIDEVSPVSAGLLGVVARLNFAGLATRFADSSGGASVVEEAIHYATEATAVVSKDKNGALWGSAMNTLGALYADRKSGDRRTNLLQAIRFLEQSLEARPEETSSAERSSTMHNLLAVKRLYEQEFEPERFSKRPSELLAQLEQRIAAFTKQGRPLLAANAKVGLARDLILAPERTEADFKRAEGLIQSALKTFRERGAVSDMVDALKWLHFVELGLKEIGAAAFYGWQALALSETLEEGAVELERVREISQSLKGLDARVALLFLSLGETAAALDTMERGRARFLRSALRLDGAASEQRTVIGKARAKVIALEREIATLNEAPREMVEAFITAREELAALERQSSPSTSRQGSENVLRRTWLIVERLMQTYDGIVVPIFDGTRCAITVLALKDAELCASVVFSEQDLAPIINRWKTANWRDPVARKVTIDAVAAELWDAFGHHAARGLVRREVAFGSRVAIVPQGELGQLPLALAREPETGAALCDMFELSFAPSIMALDRKPSEPRSPTLAAIINPTQDLPFTAIEALTSREVFQQEERAAVLFGAECTKPAVLANLRARSHWLFSAHGDFDTRDARRSGLRLSQGERLTLDDLLTFSDLEPPRLVILSACESGVHAVEEAADEFVGLPVGFLQLGAGAVLATLWPVSDASTALFISVFMTSHVAGRNRPARALQDGQRWLREATARQIRETVATFVSDEIPTETSRVLREFDQMLASLDPGVRVFEHPYYWGGFVLYGS
jgi:CHAT domain-containing protein/tetratricopeptide (TPR) repeat protein